MLKSPFQGCSIQFMYVCMYVYECMYWFKSCFAASSLDVFSRPAAFDKSLLPPFYSSLLLARESLGGSFSPPGEPWFLYPLTLTSLQWLLCLPKSVTSFFYPVPLSCHTVSLSSFPLLGTPTGMIRGVSSTSLILTALLLIFPGRWVTV